MLKLLLLLRLSEVRGNEDEADEVEEESMPGVHNLNVAEWRTTLRPPCTLQLYSPHRTKADLLRT